MLRIFSARAVQIGKMVRIGVLLGALVPFLDADTSVAAPQQTADAVEVLDDEDKPKKTPLQEATEWVQEKIVYEEWGKVRLYQKKGEKCEYVFKKRVSNYDIQESCKLVVAAQVNSEKRSTRQQYIARFMDIDTISRVPNGDGLFVDDECQQPLHYLVLTDKENGIQRSESVSDDESGYSQSDSEVTIVITAIRSKEQADRLVTALQTAHEICKENDRKEPF